MKYLCIKTMEEYHTVDEVIEHSAWCGHCSEFFLTVASELKGMTQ
jgi:hypothetical protein